MLRLSPFSIHLFSLWDNFELQFLDSSTEKYENLI